MAERLLIADPRSVVRAGLRAICLGNGIAELAEHESFSGLREVLADPEIAIAIVQVDWEGRDAFPAIRDAAAHDPTLRIVTLCDETSSTRRMRALIHGACDELRLDAGSVEIAARLTAVLALAQPQPTGELGRLFRDLQQPGERPAECDALSVREYEVLRYLSAGLDNAELARIMRIGLPTVKEHLSGMLRKMSFRDRVEAAVWGATRGLLPY
ncbi:MAG: response regulator transcription factor [Pirellulales bacterium]